MLQRFDANLSVVNIWKDATWRLTLFTHWLPELLLCWIRITQFLSHWFHDETLAKFKTMPLLQSVPNKFIMPASEEGTRLPNLAWQSRRLHFNSEIQLIHLVNLQ